MLTSELLSQVRRIEIRTGRLVAETFAGEYLSVFKGHGMEFAEVREYNPGDEVRSIDWNVTARLGRPFIKRFVEERELTLILACDISGSQHFGSRSKFKSEIAAELSALFAFAALKNNDKVGLILFSDRIELFIPPKKGKKHALRLVRELLAHTPKSKGTDIALCLDNINRLLKKRGILILISDFISQNYDRPFNLAAKRHDLIPVVIEDPLERAMPKAPALLEIQDPETGKELTYDLSSPKLHSMLYAARAERKEKLKSLFSARGVDCIELSSDKPMIDPVVKFFKERAKKFKY